MSLHLHFYIFVFNSVTMLYNIDIDNWLNIYIIPEKYNNMNIIRHRYITWSHNNIL